MEDPGDIRVHIDVLVSLDGEPLVSLVDRLFNPFSEGLADDAVGDVADVRPF